MCTLDLIDLIINGNPKNNVKKNNYELSIDKFNEILNNNQFVMNLMNFLSFIVILIDLT